MNLPPHHHPFEFSSDAPRAAYVQRLTVSFEDTNMMGNVYYVRHVAWQGRCREMFLKDHVPEILDELARDLRLVTLKTSCEYFEELHAFEDVEIRMTLAYLRQHKIGLSFEYVAKRADESVIIARGRQEIGCMKSGASGLSPITPPAALRQALEPFRNV